MSETWQFVEELTQGHLERYSRAVRETRHELQVYEGELNFIEDLPLWEWYGAFLRCAIKAGWVATEGVTPEMVADLSPDQVREYVEMAGEVYRPTKEVDPT